LAIEPIRSRKEDKVASIRCPKCGDVLYDFIIDAIAGGSNVMGSGGIRCARCGRVILHAEIRELLSGVRMAAGVPEQIPNRPPVQAQAKPVQQPAKRPPVRNTSGKQGSSCFIATAAYSVNAPEVRILRRYRDEVMTPRAAGKAFVWFYYLISPPIADWVSRSNLRKKIARTLIRPIVRLARRSLIF
jgi:phage FluMu protein Com